MRPAPAGASIWLALGARLVCQHGHVQMTVQPGETLVIDDGSECRLRVLDGRQAVGLAFDELQVREAATRCGYAADCGPLLFFERIGAAESPFPLLAAHDLRTIAASANERRGRVEAHVLDRVLRRQRGFDALVARCSGRRLRTRRRFFQRLRRVCMAVELDAVRDWDVGAMASGMRLSPWHFIRKFHDVVGETPHTWLTRHRLQAALRAIVACDEPICDVATQLGFANRSSFSRLFRHFGYPPSEARARQTARAATADASACNTWRDGDSYAAAGHRLSVLVSATERER